MSNVECRMANGEWRMPNNPEFGIWHLTFGID
jgi:hypothetical protein